MGQLAERHVDESTSFMFSASVSTPRLRDLESAEPLHQTGLDELVPEGRVR